MADNEDRSDEHDFVEGEIDDESGDMVGQVQTDHIEEADHAPTTHDQQPDDAVAHDDDPAAAFDAMAGPAAGAGRASTSSGTRKRPSPRKNQSSAQLKAFFVPVLFTVGFLMLIPGLWSVALLAGMDVWKADDPGAKRMALAMLIAAWPMAFGLIGGAFWFLIQAKKDSR